jgi:hypothetical protein
VVFSEKIYDGVSTTIHVFRSLGSKIKLEEWFACIIENDFAGQAFVDV